MRTAIFFVALAIEDLAKQNLSEDMAFVVIFFIVFLVMDGIDFLAHDLR